MWGNCKAKVATIHPPSEWPSSEARSMPSGQQKTLQHLDEPGDAVGEGRLIRAAEAE